MAWSRDKAPASSVWGEAPGNVALPKGAAGLPKASVVKVSRLATVGKAGLMEQVGRLSDEQLESVERGLRRALTL